MSVCTLHRTGAVVGDCTALYGGLTADSAVLKLSTDLEWPVGLSRWFLATFVLTKKEFLNWSV